MNIGFDSWKDILDVLIVPVSLALVAPAWPWFQLRYRRRRFIKLIRRELEELAPYDPTGTGEDWTYHQPKRFLHQDVFTDSSPNIEFILTLPADLVYVVSQLWRARHEKNLKQWMEFLERLAGSKYGTGRRFQKAYLKWELLLPKYEKGEPKKPEGEKGSPN